MVFSAVVDFCLASLSESLQFYQRELAKKDWVVEEQHEINGLQLFADHHDDVWILFWTGYTGRISGFISFKIGKLSVNLEHQPFSGIWIRQTSRPLNFQI